MLRPIADRVSIHQSELLQNTTTVVHGPNGALLIDPGITEAELACLATDLRSGGLTVTAGFAMHPDWDHVLWYPALGGAPRYATSLCAAAIADLMAAPDWRAQLSDAVPPELADTLPTEGFGDLTGLPARAPVVPWDGPRVRIIEHPAHATGHAALFIEDAGVLVAGDMLSDILVPFPDLGAVDPIGDYLIGLDRLEAVADAVRIVVPGHGSPGDAESLRDRMALDRAYVLALREGRLADDPRIGPDATYGTEWLPAVAEWQRQQLAGNAMSAG